MSDGPTTPNAALAAAAATRATGRAPIEVRRFPTGVAHYVYEALLDGGDAVVVRMGYSRQRSSLRDGLLLARKLCPLGVPLPKILADGLDDPCPWVAMERLPGSDLGEAIHSLSLDQLQDVARRVADAQRAASLSGSAGRYGYAATPEAAPHATWSAVLDENIARSRGRIASTGSFSLELADTAANLVEKFRSELDAQPSTPFLHDTTTRNVIVAQHGVLSGIVDVDDLCFGDPRYPAALTLAVLLGFGGPTSYVDAWLAAAGHADDRLFKLYVVIFLVDLMSEDGQVFNGNERPREPKARAALLRAFAENASLLSA